MSVVVAPAEGSEAAAGTNAILNSTADGSAQSSRHYQPLVALTLAVAAGIVCGRYGSRFVLSGAGWFLVCWCLCAVCLVAWLVARRHRLDAHAAWLLLAAAALAGSAWHELNWFLYDEHEIGRYADFEPAPACIDAIALESPERVS